METIIIDHLVQLDKPDSDTLFFNSFGRKNIVFIFKTSYYRHSDFTGSLSFKSALYGEEIYEFDNTRIKVDQQKYLLLNNGRTYCNEVEKNKSVYTLSVFFEEKYFQNVLSSFMSSNEALLDSVYDSKIQQINLFENLYIKNAELIHLLQVFNNSVETSKLTQAELEKFVYDLSVLILKEQKKIIKERTNNIKAAKRSTRIELCRRAHKVKDYIDSCYDEEISLQKLSEVAYLSPFHLLRVFKQVFSQTPHQCITQTRLQKANELLQRDEHTRKEIAQKIGMPDIRSLNRFLLMRNNT